MDYKISYAHRASSYNKRVRFLVLHYTATDFAVSLKALTSKVSAHYLIPDPSDKSYPQQQLSIFQLVDEQDRAWHAGVSAWENRTNLNDQAIGIEIVNQASYSKSAGFTFPPYNPDQIDAVIQLCGNILTRYPDITPSRVVGHSDIAPTRKTDPGPMFPWQQLYQHGIGAWYEPSTKAKYSEQYQRDGIPNSKTIQQQLAQYGYAFSADYSGDIRPYIQAFQMHFRSEKYDGVVDIETAAILAALVERYQ